MKGLSSHSFAGYRYTVQGQEESGENETKQQVPFSQSKAQESLLTGVESLNVRVEDSPENHPAIYDVLEVTEKQKRASVSMGSTGRPGDTPQQARGGPN